MSTFGIGTNTNSKEKNAGILKGRQIEIACDCWFTRVGKTIPRTIKFETEEGEIRALSNIRVICSEDKVFCGIKTREYICTAEFEQQEREFRLLFKKEDCRWYMIL